MRSFTDLSGLRTMRVSRKMYSAVFLCFAGEFEITSVVNFVKMVSEICLCVPLNNFQYIVNIAFNLDSRVEETGSIKTDMR